LSHYRHVAGLTLLQPRTPILQKFRGPHVAERLSNSDNTGGRSAERSSIHDHSQLVTELYNDFGRIDRDRSGGISLPEVDLFLGRPHLTDGQIELGHFLHDNFAALTKMSDGTANEINKSDLSYLKEVMDPVNPQAPDAVGTVSRAAVGGAIGGGGMAYLQDDSVGKGAGKGAAVGAVIGIVAAAAEQAHYNHVQRDRHVAESFQYADLPSDATRTKSPLTDPIEQFKPADSPANLDSLHQKVEAFRKTLPGVDFDNDGIVTVAEIKEGISNNYIPREQQPLAAALAKNVGELSSLDLRRPNGITDDSLRSLSVALQTDAQDAIHDAKKDRAIGTGVGVAAGIVYGAGIGAICGGPPGALIGAGIGAVVTGGGIFAYKTRGLSHVQEEQEQIRNERLKQTVHDLQYMQR
jgi:hypothetical protein